MIVQHIDDKWELALMPQGIGGEFVQAMPIDIAFAVRVPAPTGLRVMKAAGTIAVIGAGLGPIVTRAKFVAVGIGPGVEMRAIARDMQVLQIDQAFCHGGGHEDGIEHVLERALIERQRLEIGGPLPVEHGPRRAGHEPIG